MATGHLEHLPGAFPATPNELATPAAEDPFTQGHAHADSAIGLNEEIHTDLRNSTTASEKPTGNADTNLTEVASSVATGAATAATTAAQAAWNAANRAKEAAVPLVASAREQLAPMAESANLPAAALGGEETPTDGDPTARSANIAEHVPAPVRDSIAQAYEAPEAAANPAAVQDKAAVEGELLKRAEGAVHVPAEIQASQAEPKVDASAALTESPIAKVVAHQSAREQFLQMNSPDTRERRHEGVPSAVDIAAVGFTAHNGVLGHGSQEDDKHHCALRGQDTPSSTNGKARAKTPSKNERQEALHIADAVAGVPIGGGVYNGVAGHGSEEADEKRMSASEQASRPAPSVADAVAEQPRTDQASGRSEQALPVRSRGADAVVQQSSPEPSTSAPEPGPEPQRTKRGAVTLLDPANTEQKSKSQRSFPFFSGRQEQEDEGVDPEFGAPSAAVSMTSEAPDLEDNKLLKRRTREDTTHAEPRRSTDSASSGRERGTGRGGGFGFGRAGRKEGDSVVGGGEEQEIEEGVRTPTSYNHLESGTPSGMAM